MLVPTGHSIQYSAAMLFVARATTTRVWRHHFDVVWTVLGRVRRFTGVERCRRRRRRTVRHGDSHALDLSTRLPRQRRLRHGIALLLHPYTNHPATSTTAYLTFSELFELFHFRFCKTAYWNWTTSIHKHPFNGPCSGTTRISWYQKGTFGTTNLDFT